MKQSRRLGQATRIGAEAKVAWAVIFGVIGAILLVQTFAASAISIDNTLPVPQNVKAFPDDRNIIVTWDKVTDSRVVGYYLTYRVAGSSDEFKVRQTIHDQIQLQPLENGTEYEIFVQSVSGYVMKSPTGSLVPSAGQNHWRRGDGKVSNKTTALKSTPSSARVDAMRQRLTGFFDDFNDPAGPMNELLWNQAPSACVAPYTAAAFINPQFHTHNMARSSYCDRGGMATRPRATFDVTGATASNPALVEMDADGGNNHRNVWYIDFVPKDSRNNGYPVDITGHNDLFHLDSNNDPGNILRLNHGLSGDVKFVYYGSNHNPQVLQWEGANRACPSWTNSLGPNCDVSRKTAGISPLAQNNKPGVVPNVRKHWAVHFTGSKARLFVDGSFFGEVTLPADFVAQKKLTVHSTIFSYNTGKESDYEGNYQITPYIYLMHWDNFGFSGPAPTEVVHNYLEGGANGDTVVYGRGSESYSIPKGKRTTKIPVPDDIGTLKNGKGALYMTLNQFGFTTYTWAPGDHIIFNGTRYDVPNPANVVKYPIQIGGCDGQYSTSITPYSFTIPINQSDIRKGDNTVTFNLNGQSNGCNGTAADVMNVHLELTYDANNPNIPSYSSPLDIFGSQFQAIAMPPHTTCDQYKFIEQDLGLPYETGKANLDIGTGECRLMEGHNSSTPNPGPVDPPANNPPEITLTTSTQSASPPANYSVGATATDSDGTVAKIEIKENSSIVKTCLNAASCSYIASGIASGNYTYTATATDDQGATTTTSATSVSVQQIVQPPTSLEGLIEWRYVSIGDAQPEIVIDQSVYPNSQGVQFYYNGSIDIRDPNARPNGYDATGPNEGSRYHFYPTLNLKAGDVLEARWVDINGSAWQSQYTIENDTAPPIVVPTSYFATVPVGETLPSGEQCAAQVRSVPEVRPANATANNTRGIGSSYLYPRVDGDFVGTTDEIIQWASCKWGLDEDVLRAQMARESYWHQSAIGDFSNDPNACSNVYPIANYPPQYNGDATHNNQCPESYGLSQVRWLYHKSAFYTSQNENSDTLTNNAIYSTAFNIDYYGAVWRSCYEGEMGWLNTVEKGATYVEGDLWGCLGVWFAGRYRTPGALGYIANVQDNLNSRVWETPGFAASQPVNTIPGEQPEPVNPNPTPVVDTQAPSVSIANPSAGAEFSPGDIVTVSVTASDNVGVTEVDFEINGTKIATDNTSPWQFAINTDSLPLGQYTIRVVARDDAGNESDDLVSIVLAEEQLPLLIPGDVNGDGKVNMKDFSILSSLYGRDDVIAAVGDLNGDGKVNIKDFSILSANFGREGI